MAKTMMKNKSKKVSENKFKKKIDELKKDYSKVTTILESIGDHMSMMDKDLNILWANKIAKKVFGKNIIGKKCYVAYHKKKKPCEPYPCLILKAFRDGKLHEQNIRLIDTKGNLIYFQCTANVALRDKDGKPQAVIEISRNVTEREKAEDTLRIEKKRLEKYLNIAGVMLAAINADGKITMMNRKGCEILGYKEGELIGKNWFNLLVPQRIRDEVRGIFRKLMAGDIKPVEYYENPLLTKDGEERIIAFHNTVINDLSGRVIGTLSSGGDITERKKAEENLKRAYQATHDILEKSPFGIYLVTGKGDITYVNPAMIKIAGDTYNQFKKLNIFKLPSYKKIGLDNKIKSVLKGKPFFMGPVEYTSYYGKRTTIRNFVGIPLPVREKNEMEALIFVEDISELKRAEKELREAQKQLFQSEKMASIGRLATGVAHEVKNPLATILQGIEYLEENAPIDDRKNSLVLDYIKDAISRADDIIKELLDFSVVPKIQIKKEKLNSVLRESLSLVKYQLKKNKIQLIQNFKKDAPSIKMDKNKIQQAFINIFINAIQAMPKGGELKVTTYTERLTRPGNHIGRRKSDKFRLGELAAIVAIEDTGPGIPEDILDKIFEPFFTTKMVKGRIGMGLSIVRGIIDGHDGVMRIENKKDGHGAKVTIMFKI